MEKRTTQILVSRTLALVEKQLERKDAREVGCQLTTLRKGHVRSPTDAEHYKVSVSYMRVWLLWTILSILEGHCSREETIFLQAKNETELLITN